MENRILVLEIIVEKKRWNIIKTSTHIPKYLESDLIDYDVNHKISDFDDVNYSLAKDQCASGFKDVCSKKLGVLFESPPV